MKTRYLKLGRGKLRLGKICFSRTSLLPLASIAADGTTHIHGFHFHHPHIQSPHIQSMAASSAASRGISVILSVVPPSHPGKKAHVIFGRTFLRRCFCHDIRTI